MPCMTLPCDLTSLLFDFAPVCLPHRLSRAFGNARRTRRHFASHERRRRAGAGPCVRGPWETICLQASAGTPGAARRARFRAVSWPCGPVRLPGRERLASPTGKAVTILHPYMAIVMVAGRESARAHYLGRFRAARASPVTCVEGAELQAPVGRQRALRAASVGIFLYFGRFLAPRAPSPPRPCQP